MPKKQRGLFAHDVDEILKVSRALSMVKMRIGDAVHDGLLGKNGKQWVDDLDKCQVRLWAFLNSFKPKIGS